MVGERRLGRGSVIVISAGLFLVAANISEGKYSGGTGEPNDPYRIATPNDLNDIGNHVGDFDKCFVMVNDINLADYTGSEFNIIGIGSNGFSGVFDGNGHSISNFSYTSPGTSAVGLFRAVGVPDDANGQIMNLTLIDPCLAAGEGVGALVGLLFRGIIQSCGVEGGNVSGGDYVGGLIGQGGDDYGYRRISDCFSTASVSGQYAVGGLAGWFSPVKGDAVISNCLTAGDVSGTDNVGGLVGYLESKISSCHSSAAVSGHDYVGGLIGTAVSLGHYGYYMDICDCNASGNVSATGVCVGGLLGRNMGCNLADCSATGTVAGNSSVGGLIGSGGGEVTRCRATGAISAERRIGGLLGASAGANITYCYATGDVNCTDYDAGGLVGYNDEGTVANSYASGNVSGRTDYIGGLIGLNGNGTVTACFAIGQARSDIPLFVGALVGFSFTGASYTKCFWDRDVNPDVNGIGNASDPNVVGKSTAEMQTESTFTDAGWDFVEVWGIGDGQTYPFLRTHPAGDLNHSGLVDWRDFAILAGHWVEGVE